MRDLDEMEALGFATWAAGIRVAHDTAAMVDCGNPVIAGGMLVHHGDPLLPDKHGVLQIPNELALEIPERVRQKEARDREMIALCKSSQFSPETFAELLAKKKRNLCGD